MLVHVIESRLNGTRRVQNEFIAWNLICCVHDERVRPRGGRMKRVTQAVIAALGIAVAGSAFARYDDEVRMRMRDSFFDYARVINVDRIVEAVNQPVTHEECVKE